MLRFLGRRSQARAALVVAGHDAAEKIARAVPNLRGLGRGMMLWILAGTATCLELALEARYLVLIPAM